jgi:hypothetical protein
LSSDRFPGPAGTAPDAAPAYEENREQGKEVSRMAIIEETRELEDLVCIAYPD